MAHNINEYTSSDSISGNNIWFSGISAHPMSSTLVLAQESISASTGTPSSRTVTITPMFPLSKVNAHSSLSLSAREVLSQIKFTPCFLFSRTPWDEKFFRLNTFLINCGKMSYFIALLTLHVSRWATAITTEMTFHVTPVTHTFPSATLVLVSGFVLIDAIYLSFTIEYLWSQRNEKFLVVSLLLNRFPLSAIIACISDNRYLLMTWSRIGSSAFPQLQFSACFRNWVANWYTDSPSSCLRPRKMYLS